MAGWGVGEVSGDEAEAAKAVWVGAVAEVGGDG